MSDTQAARPPNSVHRDSWFRRFAEKAAVALGRPAAFLTAFATVLAWAIAGPFYDFSEAWQIVINTSTTIITFLMVFLLQNTQMRDSTAIHLKLDELLRALGDARTSFAKLEKLPDAELEKLREEFTRLSENADHGAVDHDLPGPRREAAAHDT
jgi:low affinity Fe/Cu permease